jgi:hypothetical protein
VEKTAGAPVAKGIFPRHSIRNSRARASRTAQLTSTTATQHQKSQQRIKEENNDERSHENLILEDYIQIRSLLVTPQNVTGTHGDKRKASGRILESGEVVLHLNLLLKNKNINHDPARG